MNAGAGAGPFGGPASGRHRLVGLFCTLLCALAWSVALCMPVQAQNEAAEASTFELTRNEDGLNLSFVVRFQLPSAVEDALLRGISLYFVADAKVMRDRWYWRDKQVSDVTRTWRLTYQPLTRKFRVAFGGISQSFDTLADALVAVRQASGWKLADASQIGDGGGHYVEFSYRLDTTLLARPMQIGIGGQPEWTLLIEKTQRVR